MMTYCSVNIQKILTFLCVLIFCCPVLTLAKDSVVGMYGIPNSLDEKLVVASTQLKESGVTAVFVRPDRDAIRFWTSRKFSAYFTLNVFGGRQPWQEQPDSIPVTAAGKKLSGKYGGVCPTHSEWRKSRLRLLERWLKDFGGENGIDGVWLDFIRYPGSWEHEQPFLPDTCYCPRCLTLFQAEKGVQIPRGLSTTESAAWIKTNAHLKWVDWKKEQIVSFVRDARRLVDQYSNEREILLGAFIVPWKKSDQNGAVSFLLAQDAQLLAPYLDVLSPMVYHKMVDEPVSWVGTTTDYFAEMGVPLWPIIQAEEVSPDELVQVIHGLNESKSDGLLIYTYRYMTDDQWPLLKDFEVSENLIPNPQLIKDESNDDVATEGEVGVPQGWSKPSASSIEDSTFWYDKLESKNKNAIGLTGGLDRKASWTTELQGCDPGDKYQFSADFYRRDRSDAQAYPEISIWGQEYRLNTHRVVNDWQKLKVRVTCTEGVLGKDLFQFKNNYPRTTFWMRSPQLTRVKQSDLSLRREPVKNIFFPLGAYGANNKNLKELKDIGLNSAVVAMTQENIEQCLELNMRCTLSVPRTPKKLFIAFEKLGPLLKRGNFSYYVNDEPGIHSFSESTARDIYDIIKDYFPNAVTQMAIVRPQAIPFYEQAADFFMLDQYPVPHMPMTWLSDSMDEAAEQVGRNRLQSIIQAFGGEKYESSGWPRLPTFDEMNCLAYLSVIHGSRGIYFYTYPSITSTGQGKEDFVRLLRRLNGMRSWLQVGNAEEDVSVRMTSKNRFDPRGNKAVHCARKEQYNTGMLICVNTIRTYTEAHIEVTSEGSTDWQDYYTGRAYSIVDGSIFSRFAPLEVKVLLESK